MYRQVWSKYLVSRLAIFQWQYLLMYFLHVFLGIVQRFIANKQQRIIYSFFCFFTVRRKILTTLSYKNRNFSRLLSNLRLKNKFSEPDDTTLPTVLRWLLVSKRNLSLKSFDLCASCRHVYNYIGPTSRPGRLSVRRAHIFVESHFLH